MITEKLNKSLKDTPAEGTIPPLSRPRALTHSDEVKYLERQGVIFGNLKQKEDSLLEIEATPRNNSTLSRFNPEMESTPRIFNLSDTPGTPILKNKRQQSKVSFSEIGKRYKPTPNRAQQPQKSLETQISREEEEKSRKATEIINYIDKISTDKIRLQEKVDNLENEKLTKDLMKFSFSQKNKNY